MASTDNHPPTGSYLKRSRSVEPGEIIDDGYSPHHRAERRASKHARIEGERSTSDERQPSRISAAPATRKQSTYLGPTSSTFGPAVRFDREYRMNNRPPYSPASGHYYRPQSLAGTPTSSYALTPLQALPTSRMSMASWFGELDIVGSPKQIEFLRKSHVSNHLGTTYPTNNRMDDFRCGELLMVPWYAPNLDGRNAIGTPTVAYAEATGAICAKKRPVVVLFKCGSTMTTLPLASSGGRGLQYKSEEVRKYNLPVKVAGDEDIDWLTREHITISESDFQPSEGSFVMCTQPYTIGANWPIKRLHAYLDKESMAKLLIMLTDLLLATMNDVAEWPEINVAPSGYIETSSTPTPTPQPRQTGLNQPLDLLDRTVRNVVRGQRGSFSMVPRSVQLRRREERARSLKV